MLCINWFLGGDCMKNNHKQKNVKQMIKQTKSNPSNNDTHIVEGEHEYIKYATVAILTEQDRKRYNSDSMAKRKMVCKTCGIEYYTNISSTCPLCEIKQLFLGLLEKGKFNDDEVVKTAIDSAKSKIQENASSSKKNHNYRYGDTIKLGNFDGKPMEWIVIRVEGNKIMAISKYGVCSMAYHSKSEAVTWEKSSLRRYLNAEFFEMYLDKNEQEIVLQTHVENKNNTLYNTIGGNDTSDRIFLLSIDETKRIFNSNKARECVASDYAKANVTYVDADTGNSWWWLRSPGEKDIYAAYVEIDGTINEAGNYIGSTRGVIRPVMWIDGNKLYDINVKKIESV